MFPLRCSRSGRTLALMTRLRLSQFLAALALVAAAVSGCVQVSSATPPQSAATHGTTENAVLPGSSDAPVAGAVASPTTSSPVAGAVDPFAPVVDIVKRA